MRYKALIVSIKGTKLSKKERILIAKYKPWGVILFKRNLKNISQIKSLIFNIKKLARNKKFPIIIDEEGESVSRLKGLINHDISANFFGNLFSKNRNFCIKIYKQYIYSLIKTLNNLGINVNTIPVLDILRNNTNKVIGTRSFSKNKKIVKELGTLTIKLLHKKKNSWNN